MKNKSNFKKGFVHIYTGKGKGKTTAALGLALRAAGAGRNVCFLQFLKGKGLCSSEFKAIKKIKNIKFIKFNRQFYPVCRQEEKCRLSEIIINDIKSLSRMLRTGKFDMVIFDEIINTVSEKIIPEKIILDLIKTKPKKVELVLTGRGATKKIIEAANYVSQIRQVKHPYAKGLLARRAIEY